MAGRVGWPSHVDTVLLAVAGAQRAVMHKHVELEEDQFDDFTATQKDLAARGGLKTLISS